MGDKIQGRATWAEAQADADIRAKNRAIKKRRAQPKAEFSEQDYSDSMAKEIAYNQRQAQLEQARKLTEAKTAERQQRAAQYDRVKRAPGGPIADQAEWDRRQAFIEAYDRVNKGTDTWGGAGSEGAAQPITEGAPNADLYRPWDKLTNKNFGPGVSRDTVKETLFQHRKQQAKALRTAEAERSQQDFWEGVWSRFDG